jgi:hypothetical protein
MSESTELCWIRLVGEPRNGNPRFFADGHALFLADTPLKLMARRTDREYRLTIRLPAENPPALGPGLKLV